MPKYRAIQRKIDKGRGKAAKVLSPPHDVYRIGETSGDFIQPANLVKSKVPMYRKVKTSKDIGGSLEANKWQELTVYDLIGDLSKFKLGDVFIVKDPYYGDDHTQVAGTKEINGFYVASHAPIKRGLGPRINTLIRIRRQSTRGDADGFASTTSDNAPCVKIVSGRCRFSLADDDGSWIPAGLVATRGSYGDKAVDDVPSMIRKSAFVGVVPPLPGFKFRPGDRVESISGAKYMVVVAYPEETGFCGTQLFLELENAADDGDDE